MSKKPTLKKNKITTDATRFAHLMKAEEGDTDQNDPTTEEGDNQDPDAQGDGQNPEDPKDQNGRAKGKKAKKAEEDPKDPDAQDDDNLDAEEDGDDETDAEDEDDEPKAQARARERGRCAAIFGCKAARNNLALAAELAFGTNMPRSQAIRVLKSGAISQPNSTGRSSKISAYDQKMMRSRQSLSVGGSKSNQPISRSSMQANQILKSAQGTGVVKKECQS